MKRHKKLILVSVLISFIITLSVLLSNNGLPGYIPIISEIVTPGSQYLSNTKTSSVRVGDIDMSYKIFGTGPPILLIMGFGGTINNWPPAFLKDLSSSHTVVVFDNRGMGSTTTGIKKFSMKQFTEDTAAFLDALNIKRTDVLGISMGGKIAQELALRHPDKVGKLVLISTYCGSNKNVPSYDKETQTMLRKALTNSTFLASPEGRKLLAYLTYPQEWLKENQGLPKNGDATISNHATLDSETLKRQLEAEQTWDGVCGKLKRINHPTLIMTGIEDIVVPSAHSLILAENIPGAWLVPIKGAGHAVIAQYPDKVSEVILAFLKQSII